MASTEKNKGAQKGDMKMPGKGQKAPVSAQKKETGSAEKSGQATTKREQNKVKKG